MLMRTLSACFTRTGHNKAGGRSIACPNALSPSEGCWLRRVAWERHGKFSGRVALRCWRSPGRSAFFERAFMFKTFMLAGLLSIALSTTASAENWVTTPASALGLTSIYDADSVYVEASTGLVYVTTCDQKPCVASSSVYENIGRSRYDCDAQSVSYDDGEGRWSTPATRSTNEYNTEDNKYSSGTTAAEVLDAVCAQRNSWPKR